MNFANRLCLSFNFKPAFAATFASGSFSELKHSFVTHIFSTPLQMGHKILQKVKVKDGGNHSGQGKLPTRTRSV